LEAGSRLKYIQDTKPLAMARITKIFDETGLDAGGYCRRFLSALIPVLSRPGRYLKIG
jgi:hypothetical protein